MNQKLNELEVPHPENVALEHVPYCPFVGECPKGLQCYDGRGCMLINPQYIIGRIISD